MSKRAERRARTEAVRSRRVKEWDRAMGDNPWPVSRGIRTRSPFDCGKTQCATCRPGPRRERGTKLEIKEALDEIEREHRLSDWLGNRESRK